MFDVYIIYSEKLDRYYVGYTKDVTKRLIDHNAGISTFTSKAQDWVIKFQQSFSTREDAMDFERKLKSKKSRKYLEWLITQG